MDEATVRAKLSRYIAREIMRDPDYELEDDEPIISGGLMDSFSLAKVGVFCEKEFGVFIPDPDLTVAKMDTLKQMVTRVLRDLQ